MQIDIVRAGPADANALLAVFDASFLADFQKYGECPGYGRSMESMLQSIEECFVYKIRLEGETIGAISVREQSEGCYYLGALCVVPAFQGKGIGQQAMAFLDREFPQAVHWALETPADKTENHSFYQKHGYKITKEYLDGKVKICYFERKH